jgi:predicted amidophosphoribosyltransferase
MEQCVLCASRELNHPNQHACEICDQAVEPGRRCTNRLCQERWRRQFTRVHAIGLKERGSPLEQTILRYKYRSATGWSLIFARLLLGWLEQTMDPAAIDLIVASPTYTGPPEFRAAHTEAVIDSAAVQDTRSLWPFDQQQPRAILATGPRPQSAGGNLAAKRASAAALATVLFVPDASRVTGRHVLVYDDVLTSGETMNAVAAVLRAAGAAKISGVVLARQTWAT